VPHDFEATLADLDLDLEVEQLDLLRAYRDRLAAASREFNLTSLRDPEAIERRHIVESLALGRHLAARSLLQSGARLLDIGSGAGLPGLPLRIAWPGISLVMLESVGKKCRFLEDVSRELGLRGVEVIEGRAEDAGQDPRLRGSFDLVVARAVAPLPVLLEYSLPFLKTGGRLAASKGSAALREIDEAAAALDALGGRLEDAQPFLPPNGLPQTIVIVEKVAETPSRYPRRAGIPSKRPLT
jgi:16S rRNA (guanine527-N7)-methyltransferase